jgi:hypothetical protein
MNNVKKAGFAAAVVGASVLGGVFGATVMGTAGAQTTSTTAASSSSSSAAPSTGSTSTPSQPSMPAHGSSEHESAETAVTGANATSAQDAAVKSIGSGTAGEVTTDFTGKGYEVTVTKADGTQVEVHLDSSFNVMTGPRGR